MSMELCEVHWLEVLRAIDDPQVFRPAALHTWHLEMIDRLVAAAPAVYRGTRRRFVDLASEAEVADAVEGGPT